MAHIKALSTKRIDPSLKREAMQKGIEITDKEFICIRPVQTPAKKEAVLQWAKNAEGLAVIFTSSNAVENTVTEFNSPGNRDILPSWKIFCLDGATKKTVLADFPGSRIISTAAHATALADKIIEQDTYKKLVFFCGNKRRDELPAQLKRNGIEVIEVVVYETIETPVSINEYFDAVLFFSPLAAGSFFSLNSIAEKTVCFAVGATTAKAISGHTANPVITSKTPDQEALINSVNLYFQTFNRSE